jgi:hypothetical protein
MNSSAGWAALLIFSVLAVLILRRAWQISRRKHEAQEWPATEATIQSVRKVSVPQGRSRVLIDVGDFSYIVNNDYYSGRTMISRSFSTHQAISKDLTGQKIQVRYNPRNPEKYSVPQQELGGFLLDPFDYTNATDTDPFDLEIDKI